MQSRIIHRAPRLRSARNEPDGTAPVTGQPRSSPGRCHGHGNVTGMFIVMLDGAVSAVDVQGRQASAYHCVKKAKSVWFLFLAWGNPWFLTRHRACCVLRHT